MTEGSDGVCCPDSGVYTGRTGEGATHPAV